MGVPAFYRWLSEKYPKTISVVIEDGAPIIDEVPEYSLVDIESPNPNAFEVDNLYIDMNGIIHPCSHPENGEAPPSEEHMYINVMKYIDRLVAAIRPRRLLYLAIDGVAPRAKMNQQRARRFRGAQEIEENLESTREAREYMKQMGHAIPAEVPVWDSNVITPGTKFMTKLSKYLQFYIQDRLNNIPGWKNLKVVLSDASVPGEGEHKIMSYIRQQRSQVGYDPNQHHVLHGLDADLIMLALATHEAKFTISREEVLFGKAKWEASRKMEQNAEDLKAGHKRKIEDLHKPSKPFQFLHVSVLREYLAFEFECLSNTLPFAYDFENVIDDFVFLCFFVGNDFLPHLPSMDIRDGALDFLMILYKQLLPTTMGGYLTTNGVVNLPNVDMILARVGLVEDEIFRRRRQKEEQEKHRHAQQNRQRQQGGASRIAARSAVDSAQAVTRRDKVQSKVQNDTAAEALKAQLKGTKTKTVQNPEEVAKYVGMDASVAIKLRVKEKEEAKRSACRESVNDVVQLGLNGWKDRYYSDKYKSDDISHGGGRERVYLSYIEGLCWVMKYYYSGVASWKWFYPFHYAPFASDLVNVAQYEITFEIGEPFCPFEQLMGVFPASSGHALPKPYRNLMRDPESPIIDFYPTIIPVDPNGKAMPWLWVVLLPFIEEDRLLASMGTVASLLKDGEKKRNVRYGKEVLYVHKNHSMACLMPTPPKSTTGKAAVSEATAVKDSEAVVEWSASLTQSFRGSVEFHADFHVPLGENITCPKSPVGVLFDVPNNVSLSGVYHMPSILPHICALLPDVEPVECILEEQDRNISIPRLGRGTISIVDLAGGAPSGNSRQQHNGHNKPREFNQYMAEGYRNWGSMEPRRIEKRNRPMPDGGLLPNPGAPRGVFAPDRFRHQAPPPRGTRPHSGNHRQPPQGNGNYDRRDQYQQQPPPHYQQQQQYQQQQYNQPPPGQYQQQQYQQPQHYQQQQYQQPQRYQQQQPPHQQQQPYQQGPPSGYQHPGHAPSRGHAQGPPPPAESGCLDALRAGLRNMHQQRGTLPSSGPPKEPKRYDRR